MSSNISSDTSELYRVLHQWNLGRMMRAPSSRAAGAARPGRLAWQPQADPAPPVYLEHKIKHNLRSPVPKIGKSKPHFPVGSFSPAVCHIGPSSLSRPSADDGHNSRSAWRDPTRSLPSLPEKPNATTALSCGIFLNCRMNKSQIDRRMRCSQFYNCTKLFWTAQFQEAERSGE